MMMVMIALAVVALMLLALQRGHDVRLVLILGGIVLTSIVGRPLVIIDSIGKTLGNVEVTGPICSAMGYAFVLRAIGADKELVALLARPLRSVGWLLIPGGVLIGFLTNIAIPSQTAAAAAVGPILLPLMYAAGFSRLASGATLLVGCSIGGSLLNPGDADIVAVHTATMIPVGDVIDTMLVPSLVSVAVAIFVLVFQLRSMGMRSGEVHQLDRANDKPLTVRRMLMAILAPLPVLVLFVTQPGLNLFPYITQYYPHGLPVYSVMLAASFLAMAVSLSSSAPIAAQFSKLTVEFFDGMGYGLAKIVSIIIAAGCFIAGLHEIGVIKPISQLLLTDSSVAMIASPVTTWLMAVMSGSGTAPAVSFAQAVLPTIVDAGAAHLAVVLGVLASIGASIGRTMSPVSAVMYFVSDLSTTEPRDLMRTVALPLVSGLIAAIACGLVSL
ncbi:MAG: hypothetical protein FJ211_06620 [Ignavibacteria bacterium]|nr:hypothetical protein [Ignavibacteria bacterium]